MKICHILFIFISVLILTSSCTRSHNEKMILYSADTSKNETLAAKEIKRYLYQRTGKLIPIVQTNTIPKSDKDFIIISRKGSGLITQISSDDLKDAVSKLKKEEFLLKTVRQNGNTIVLLSGGDDIGTLYAAYRFAEHLGIRFYLHSDVIPDEKIDLSLPDLNEIHTPLFSDRGIQPFHDFTEGPDWWTLDDYKTYMSQLVKMRMNWIGFHCYPEGVVGPEPLVWIGLADDLNDDGTVNFSYPSRWASTSGGSWGYEKTKTSEFSAGAGLLFPGDDFGSPVTDGYRPMPETNEESNAVFNRTGAFLHDAFSYGREMGIKVVVGTETPLTIPSKLKNNLQKKGEDPNDPGIVQKLYEGIFTRIAKSYPIDYYWLWTPEDWTWDGTKEEEVKTTIKDMNLALAALDKIGKPFSFAICGWVLGPPDDRALFDKILPKDVPLSCINRYVGFYWVEQGFAEITGRPQWAIPWMEDDPALIIPQLWVGRMRKDAADALAYGCSGLMGIHWRTAVLAPNIAALARAAWEQKLWNPNFAKPWIPEEPLAIEGGTDAQYADFTNAKIRNTTEEEIYKTMAYGMTDYYLQVPNGKYDVQLKFCELNFHEAEKRVFDVKIQNNVVVRDLDIFAESGFSTALDKNIENIKILNGELHINFDRKKDNTSLAGIVIKDSKTSNIIRKVNCGGKSFKDYTTGPGLLQKKTQKPRDLPVEDFYIDWAGAEFGKNVAKPLAKIFTKLDGGIYRHKKREANLPRPSDWIGGPGGIRINKTPWDQEKDKYRFVEEMIALRPRVSGAGNLYRFDYWLNTFRFLRSVGEIGCIRGELDRIMEEIESIKDGSKQVELGRRAVGIRTTLARQWEDMMTLLLQTVETPGEFGTVANCEQHVRRNYHADRFLELHDEKLVKLLGEPLPPDVHPTTEYRGNQRIIVPTRRSRAEIDEKLSISIIILDKVPPQSAVLNWRPMGTGKYQKIALDHLGRAVYRATLPPASENDFEYYIEATLADGKILYWPATAPELNQTVVVN